MDWIGSLDSTDKKGGGAGGQEQSMYTYKTKTRDPCPFEFLFSIPSTHNVQWNKSVGVGIGNV